jgi:flagellum-specific ATP synthase
MPIIVENESLSFANRFRRLWTLYQQNQDLIQVGAYSAGSNKDIDEAIELRNEMEEFLRQPMDEIAKMEDSLARLAVCLGRE